MIEHFLIGPYPRSRGENLQFLHHACAMSGSSPLTLGKLEGVHADLPDVRLIPAHAGKTSADPRGAASSPAHPRSRGENAPRSVPSSWYSGSYPLMRGKQHGSQVRQGRDGLIPAHAGKTQEWPRCACASTAHPRSRGENNPQLRLYGLGAGSSPLTRGKPIAQLVASVGQGLIPAHAGKTTPRQSTASHSPAHPRSRRENTGQMTLETIVHGSSPLTRGKHRRSGRRRRRGRLIPAHAGKTISMRPASATRPAHPRSRGENSASSAS